MNIENLYKKIIPKNYQNNSYFNNENEDLLNKLSDFEKKEIEKLLIENLKISDDTLIVETLAYLKSYSAIPLIHEKLILSKAPTDKIIFAISLYNLNYEKDNMIEIVYNSFLEVKNKYTLTYLFYYLVKLNDIRINDYIKSFANCKDNDLSYNSITALSLGKT
jgi:hypothetical protein